MFREVMSAEENQMGEREFSSNDIRRAAVAVKRRLTPEETGRIIGLRDRGVPGPRIAEEADCSVVAVYCPRTGEQVPGHESEGERAA